MIVFFIVYVWVIAVTMGVLDVFDLLPGWDGWVVGVGLALIFLGVICLLWGTSQRRNRHLKGTGIEGTARGMAWPESDGTASNVMGDCILRVSLPGREPYLVEQALMIPERHRAAFVSQPVPVWVDPKDRNRVFIDWEQVPTAAELARQKHEAMLRGERVE